MSSKHYCRTSDKDSSNEWKMKMCITRKELKILIELVNDGSCTCFRNTEDRFIMMSPVLRVLYLHACFTSGQRGSSRLAIHLEAEDNSTDILLKADMFKAFCVSRSC